MSRRTEDLAARLAAVEAELGTDPLDVTITHHSHAAGTLPVPGDDLDALLTEPIDESADGTVTIRRALPPEAADVEAADRECVVVGPSDRDHEEEFARISAALCTIGFDPEDVVIVATDPDDRSKGYRLEEKSDHLERAEAAATCEEFVSQALRYHYGWPASTIAELGFPALASIFVEEVERARAGTVPPSRSDADAEDAPHPPR